VKAKPVSSVMRSCILEEIETIDDQMRQLEARRRALVNVLDAHGVVEQKATRCTRRRKLSVVRQTRPSWRGFALIQGGKAS